MTDLDTALAGAKRPERTVPLCLRGDLQAEFEDLERQLQVEQERPGDSLAGNPAVRQIAEQIEGLRQQMQDSTVVVRLRGLGNAEWNALVRSHEPRDGNETDNSLGYNVETFFPALVKACLVDVTDAQWDRLYEAITSGQFENLNDAALAVSRRKVDVPKSFVASEVLRKPAEKQS
jgi:predicted phage tail protein